MSEDESYLNSLAIAHYVAGALMVLLSFIPLIHVGIGLSVLIGSDGGVFGPGESPPLFFGWMFVIGGLFAFLIGQAVSVSVIVSGRFLRKRRHYYFSFILGCIACAMFPFGTILGVFTILVLSRGSVKEMYGLRP